MSESSAVFKVSRAGKVIHENLSLAQVVEGISLKAVLPSDHYWTSGMAAWALVSSRQWTLPVIAAPVAAPSPAADPKPASLPAQNPAPKNDSSQVSVGSAAQVQVEKANVAGSQVAAPAPSKPSAPAPAVSSRPSDVPARPVSGGATPPRQPAAPAMAEPVEKGFSPYVTFYRSNDDRWCFGIFGGLAHRNCWPKPLLLLVRVLTLITFIPGLAYLGWGFTAMLLTPSLPTSRVRSYYDLNNGKPSQDATDFGRLIKILVVGIIIIVAVISILSRRS